MRSKLFKALLFVAACLLSLFSVSASANTFAGGIPQSIPFTYNGVIYDRYIVISRTDYNICSNTIALYFNSSEMTAAGYPSGNQFSLVLTYPGNIPAFNTIPEGTYMAIFSAANVNEVCSWTSNAFEGVTTVQQGAYTLYADKSMAIHDHNFDLYAKDYVPSWGTLPHTFDSGYESWGRWEKDAKIYGSIESLLPNTYDPAKLPKPLPYTYNGTTYYHAIAWPYTGFNDHWVMYYNGDLLTWNWPYISLPQNNVCFYQASPNGYTPDGPSTSCLGISVQYNNCDKSHYSDVEIYAMENNILQATSTCLVGMPYNMGTRIVGGKSYNVTTSLKWPLNGTYESRLPATMSFGDNWPFSECPTQKFHAGIDVHASRGESVYAAHDGTVKIIFTGNHAKWADAIVLEDDSHTFTTVYWHIVPQVTLNQYVHRGEKIAIIADLRDPDDPNNPDKDKTHFHFGLRIGPSSEPQSYAGALPIVDACGGYKAFPENFIDPATLTFSTN